MAKAKKQLTTRDLQAIERREQLLQAATELFAAKGYHATPIREINRKIGMADGLLYHYFPGGKLEILQAIVNEAKTRRIGQFDAFADKLDRTRPLEDILLDVIRFLHTLMQGEQLVLMIQLRERELLDGEVNKALERLILERIAWMQELLEVRMQAGEVRPMDSNLAARQFMSVWMSVMFQMLSGIDLIQQEHDDYFRAMTRHLVETWKP